MKGGVFSLTDTYIIQERETTAEGVRMKSVVWITKGTFFVRCAAQHLFSFRIREKITGTESISFEDFVRCLSNRTFLDFTTPTDVPDDAWEDEITSWNPRSTRDPNSSSTFLAAI